MNIAVEMEKRFIQTLEPKFGRLMYCFHQVEKLVQNKGDYSETTPAFTELYQIIQEVTTKFYNYFLKQRDFLKKPIEDSSVIVKEEDVVNGLLSVIYDFH